MAGQTAPSSLNCAQLEVFGESLYFWRRLPFHFGGG